MASQKYNILYGRLRQEDERQRDDRQKESNSIHNQKLFLEQYAADHGFENTLFLADDGYSGTNFDRPAWKKVIEMVERDEMETIIVKDLSRLGREYLQVGQYTEIYFPEKGVRFIAVNDGVDSLVESSNDFNPIRNWANELHAKDTSKKVRAIKKMQAERGERLGGKPPYGYKKKDKDSKEIIPDEETAPIVRRIFDLCAAGKGAEPDRQNPDPRAGAESDQPVLSDYRSCLYQSGYHPFLHLVRKNRSQHSGEQGLYRAHAQHEENNALL